MKQNELKPCPFCGGSVKFDKAYSYFRDSVLYCNDCDMVFTLDDCHASDEQVAEAWNRRRAMTKLEQVKRERDAAVHALKENRRCETCRHYIPGYFCPGCRNLDKWESRYV